MLKTIAVLCLVLVCASIRACLAQNATEETPEIQIPLGKLKGSYITSRLGKQIYSFRGVRYAEAPIGQQRFQPPIPVKPWDIFDASEEGPSCPQKSTDIAMQSEDCLRLNVYTTKLSTASEIVKRPVIVFFHPGGLYEQSSQSSIYGPQYLLDHDIVLVTVNYRLSSLGFMSTGDSLLPGNLGLKDQVEALRWVKKNIASFGGDSNSVTISGYSAGSWSVSLHLVSPMSKGLFHRAIASSGSATFQEPLPTNQTHLAKKQAEILGCPTDTVGNMLVCLNTKTAEEFAKSIEQIFESYQNTYVLWLPVVEPEVRGVERFLPAQPTELIKQGKFQNVPLISGITKDEIDTIIFRIIQEIQNGDDSEIRNFNENWETTAPIQFLYESNTECSKKISKRLKQFYLHDKSVSLEHLDGIGHLYSDGTIVYPVHRLVNLVAEASDQPVYYYKFTYQGPYSHFTWNNTIKPYGVIHQDDLLYIFRKSSFPEFDKNSSEIKTIERITSIWSNFAKTGEPIPKEDEDNIFANITWEKFTPNNNKFLEIGNDLVMQTNLYSDRMKIWDELFLQKCMNNI